jgi:hypothetical protein
MDGLPGLSDDGLAIVIAMARAFISRAFLE